LIFTLAVANAALPSCVVTMLFFTGGLLPAGPDLPFLRGLPCLAVVSALPCKISVRARCFLDHVVPATGAMISLCWIALAEQNPA